MFEDLGLEFAQFTGESVASVAATAASVWLQ
jgi:hypothetical protein